MPYIIHCYRPLPNTNYYNNQLKRLVLVHKQKVRHVKSYLFEWIEVSLDLSHSPKEEENVLSLLTFSFCSRFLLSLYDLFIVKLPFVARVVFFSELFSGKLRFLAHASDLQ